MYFEEEEEYMSEPIDEISESSYIKINKRFLQQLKQANQIDDLSRYRQESDDEQDQKIQNKLKIQTKSQKQKLQSKNQQIQFDSSPIKSNFYKDIIGHKNWEEGQNDSIVKSSGSKNKESKNQTPEDKRQFMKMTQKISKLSHFQKKQVCTPSDNTFEYYLVRKSHDRKHKDSQILRNELQQDNDMNEIQTKPQLFSPKHQVSSSNRVQNQQKTQFERINYKKLLQNEMSKNKEFQKQLYKLQSKLAQLNLQYEESTKLNKKLEKELNNSNKIRKQNKNRMKELDLKLQGFKGICKVKNTEKDQLLIETKKQNKNLKEQNQKYRVFTQTLAQSIFVLKGKKSKNLEDIWSEWKDIFETFSKNKWSLTKTKSHIKRA